MELRTINKKVILTSLSLLVFLLFFSCRKDEEIDQRQPEITNEVVTTTPNSATLSWGVEFPGDIHTGIELSLNEELTSARFIEASKVTSSQSVHYSVSIDSLIPNNQYYYRVLVWNSYKRYEFETKAFTTEVGLPIVETLEVHNITRTSAIGGGKIIRNGGVEIIECGICWATTSNLTIDANHIVAENIQETYTLMMTGLVPEIQYYVCAYAKNSKGIVYGEKVCFISGDAELPIVTTLDIADMTATTAKGGGFVTDDGGAAVTERGICWSVGHNPTINDNNVNSGVGVGEFIANIDGLFAETSYYVRAYAKNRIGIAYGEEKCFTTTEPELPIVTTSPLTNITKNSAIGGGSVTFTGGVSDLVLGVCWATTPNPTTNDNHTTLTGTIGDFSCDITELELYTRYYVRAYALNVAGIAYGAEESFTTLPQGSIHGLFSVSDTKRVCFSQGNLQYKASTDTWRFAEHQWDYVGTTDAHLGEPGGTIPGSSNDMISPTYNGWIDLFGFGTGNNPTNAMTNLGDYSMFYDWGNNVVSNGGNSTDIWRTLTKEEWGYVFNIRGTNEGIRYVKAVVNNVNGVILLPDDWRNDTYSLVYPNIGWANYSSNIISSTVWLNSFEANGAVFLPAAGYRVATGIYYVNSWGCYNTSTYNTIIGDSNQYAFVIHFNVEGLSAPTWDFASTGRSVRLIYDAE